MLALTGCNRHPSESAAIGWAPIVARAALDRAEAGDEDRFALRGAHQRLPLRIPPDASLQIGFALSPPPNAATLRAHGRTGSTSWTSPSRTRTSAAGSA